MQYTDKQEQAISIIANRWMFEGRGAVVTVAGYAGTGKTTIVREAVRLIEEHNDGKKIRIKFACYTGKAARVLTSKLSSDGEGMSATTLHSLLYTSYPWEYFDDDETGERLALLDKPGVIKTADFVHVPNSTLGCDIVVVDEASMVPPELWKQLRQHNVMLILLGDPAQLPPVISKETEVNSIDNDAFDSDEPVFPLIDNPEAYDIFLDEIMRQQEESSIIRMSMLTRQHQNLYPSMSTPTFKIVFKDRLMDVINSYTKRISENKDDITSHILLCRNNRTRIAINRYIHELLGFKTNDIEPGDRVVCLRNNRNIRSNRNNIIVNGIVGVVDGIHKVTHEDKRTEMVANIVSDDQELYSSVPLTMLDMAYAITVHKSQGSEYRHVIVLTEWAEMWDSEYYRWLYTAITRAKETCTIVKSTIKDSVLEQYAPEIPRKKRTAKFDKSERVKQADKTTQNSLFDLFQDAE